jgi:hypothetical protein
MCVTPIWIMLIDYARKKKASNFLAYESKIKDVFI